jgi:hypothetical protein
MYFSADFSDKLHYEYAMLYGTSTTYKQNCFVYLDYKDWIYFFSPDDRIHTRLWAQPISRPMGTKNILLFGKAARAWNWSSAEVKTVQMCASNPYTFLRRGA